MIAVHPAQHRERLAAVVRDVQAEAQRVDRVLVGRIDADLPEHPAVGAGVLGHEVVVLADLAPRPALVVGAIDLGGPDAALQDRPAVRVTLAVAGRTPFLVAVHERVEHVRVAARHVEADAAAELRAPAAPGRCWSRSSRRRSSSRCRSRCSPARRADRSTCAACAATSRRRACSGSDGSITRSIAPVRGLR